jgi:tRNA(Met) cytidine acetyltransferase
MHPGHRHLIVLRGDAPEPPLAGEGLHIGPGGLPAEDVKRLLGKSFDFVVLDAREGLDADVLGQAHGFIRGGGALVLRLWVGAAACQCGAGGVALRGRGRGAPVSGADRGAAGRVRGRVWGPGAELGAKGWPPAAEHPEQARVVAQLIEVLTGPPGRRVVILSDRGRGKSSALGLALRGLPADLNVVVTAGQPESIVEVERFAPGPVRYLPPAALVAGSPGPGEIAKGNEHFDAILVDEAAQIPVPLLQQIVRRHPTARMIFATTARGYEGTGRGFVLRFLEWLKSEGPVLPLTLTEPIRWAAGDPLERWIFDVLLLDAQPAQLEGPVDPAAIEAVALDRDVLVADETQLREFFGLLVHAHYRTTPGDLHRLLDAPNLRLHALRHRGQVVAACLLALEGGLTPAMCRALAEGKMRLRGHALPETLGVHAGEVDAGTLSMVRSVRIAVHPELRRLGLGQRLVEHVHAHYQPDLFGTVFGGTADLLRFRREVGYELVRVGASRGSRTGEPAAVMIRPVSPRAHTLLAHLRTTLARDLPAQLAWMGQGTLCVTPELEAALCADLPEPAPLSDEDCAHLSREYAFGPRTLESVLVPLRRFLAVCEARGDLARLPAEARRLLAGVQAGQGWEVTAGHMSLPAAMRAVRRGVRGLFSG